MTSVASVYTEEEEVALVEEAWKDYLKNPEVTTPLAVILLFYLGVRVGEVVALKDTDIHGNTIEIGAMERRVFQSEDGIEYHQVDRQIVENTKTPAGNRKLPVVKEAMDIIKIAMTAIPIRSKGPNNFARFCVSALMSL